MSTDESPRHPDNVSGGTKPVIRTLLQVAVLFPILAMLLFVPAGQLGWAMGWSFIGAYLAGLFLSTLLPALAHRGLAMERIAPPQGAKEWDRKLLNLYHLLSLLVLLPLAGFDRRFGWSPRMHVGVPLAAMVVLAMAYSLVGWAMVVNPFFSAVVRIQSDRGHSVVASGPYRCVRHPAYAGWIAMTLASALVLESVWALIPATCAVVVLVVRTALEDRALLEELDAYRAYARRVRYRLLPGVW
jgi:protein-S-isoprenylcysteine O-methyltransferase Ste14